MAVPMTDAYPWAHAADVGAGGGVDTLALFCRLRKEGAIVFNWATRALTDDDDNVTGDRPEAAARKKLHTTVRTLTFHTAAPYDPASRSFCVNLGKPPHLLRDMPGLVPEHALDAAPSPNPRPNPGFCTIADAGPAKDTACACVAIIEGVTVENARAQVYVMPREKEPCAQWAAEFTARPALFEHALNKSLVAPTVSLVRGRARPHAYAAYTAATAASPGRAPVRCDVLRAAWFTVRHCTAFRCGLSSGAPRRRRSRAPRCARRTRVCPRTRPPTTKRFCPIETRARR